MRTIIYYNLKTFKTKEIKFSKSRKYKINESIIFYNRLLFMFGGKETSILDLNTKKII